MSRVRRRPMLAGAFAVVSAMALAVPVTWSQLSGAASSAGLPANPTYDEIQYGQQTGSNGNYMSFVPATANTAHETGATQSMVGGGGCSSGPIIVNPGNPLLAINAFLYPSGTVEKVGAYRNRTGVCVNNSGGDQAIDAGEGISFQVSASSAAGNGRQVADGQIVVSRADKNTTADSVMLVELLNGLGGTQEASQSFSIPAGASSVTLDSDCGGFAVLPPAGSPACGAGSTPATTFTIDTVEVVNTGPVGDSVAVVPTSIVYLTQEICGGEQLPTINSTDGNANVNGFVKLNITPTVSSTTCKSYNAYQDNANDTAIPGYTESFSFNSGSLNGADSLIQTNWNGLPFCEPDSNQPLDQTNAPTCHPTLVSWQGAAPVPALYCSSWADMNATWNPANGTIPPGCITSETVTYTTVAGVTYTNIQQTWDVVGDYLSRN